MKSLFLAMVLAAGVATFAISASPAASADDSSIVHVLNRVAFGPRPHDIEAVKAMGLRAYIDQQLYPERILDADLAGRLSNLTTVTMSSRQIAQQFEQPLLEAQREQKQEPPDPAAGVSDQPKMPDP